MWHKKLIAIILSLLWPLAAAADTLTIPNSFTPGTSAQSSQVNANFTAISNLINGNITNSNIKSGAAIDPTKLDLTAAIPILRASGNNCFAAGTTGDTEYRCVITSDGYLKLGIGSATAPDIMIKRETGPLIAIRNAADSAYADLKAAALTLSGALSGTSATLSGNLAAVDGTFSGNVSGVGGTFSGAVSGTTGTFSDDVSGVDGTFSGAVSGTTGTFTGALQAPSLTLSTTPLAAASGGTGLSAYGSALQQLRMNSGGTALEYFTPSNAGVFNAAAISSTLRDPGTGGSISGDYVYNGNITTASSWTMASGTRLYIKGNLTVGHAITVSNLGNGAPWITDGGTGCAGGVGPGTSSGPSAAGDAGGGGAGYGDGGNGQTVTYGSPGGQSGGLAAVMLGGSGGGRSYYTAGAAGGGAVYIEVDGDVTLNEGISAVGAASSAASAYSGGGGGGGTVVIRCTGDYTIAASKAINVSGGAAAAAASGRGGGGGGGYIEVWCGGTATVTGSHTVSGGAGSSSGSSGTATVISGADPVSWF